MALLLSQRVRTTMRIGTNFYRDLSQVYNFSIRSTVQIYSSYRCKPPGWTPTWWSAESRWPPAASLRRQVPARQQRWPWVRAPSWGERKLWQDVIQSYPTLHDTSSQLSPSALCHCRPLASVKLITIRVFSNYCKTTIVVFQSNESICSVSAVDLKKVPDNQGLYFQSWRFFNEEYETNRLNWASLSCGRRPGGWRGSCPPEQGWGKPEVAHGHHPWAPHVRAPSTGGYLWGGTWEEEHFTWRKMLGLDGALKRITKSSLEIFSDPDWRSIVIQTWGPTEAVK